MSQGSINFFKALADSNRLKILGLLAQQPYSVEELAALLQLKPPTVSHHLAKLVEVGLVTARAESYYNLYQLEIKKLEEQSRSLLSRENLTAAILDVDLNAYDRKVIKDYSARNGSLKTLPSQRKKLEAILRHVVKAFKTDKRYTEEQVNELLAHYNKDTATLRRELVGSGLMQRENNEYWRT